MTLLFSLNLGVMLSTKSLMCGLSPASALRMCQTVPPRPSVSVPANQSHLH